MRFEFFVTLKYKVEYYAYVSHIRDAQILAPSFVRLCYICVCSRILSNNP